MYLLMHVHVYNIIKIRYNIIQGTGDACQKPIYKIEGDSNFTSLMCAVVVCLFIISVIFVTCYMYIKLRMKPYVDVTQDL